MVLPNHFPPPHGRLAIWTWDNSASAYVDNSAEARSPTGTAFTVLGDTNDYLYIGLEDKFDMGIFFMASVGAISGVTTEYYDGDSWNVSQTTFEYNFSADGVERYDRMINWTPLLFTATSPHSATPPDNIPRYWIRISATSITTAPSINRIVIRPMASYATPSDVASILQLGYEFSSETTPTKNQVEGFIRDAQGTIEFKTNKSWRPNYVQNEEHMFNPSGFQLVKSYPTNILSLSIWDGGSFETKTGSGINNTDRTNDFFLVPDTGMLYFSRFFILPARLQSYRASLWGWGFGEFQFPVRVSYIYGSNLYTNEREGLVVNSIAKKLAAIDVLTMHDYSLIVSSGGDRISLERKAEIWRIETEDEMESLRSWQIY
jgi:hypothetical protein